MTTLIAAAFLSALQSDAPSPEIAGNDLYAFLLGSWEVDVLDVDDRGVEHRARGEWHFARVLEGRAVQDVWISPPRKDRKAAVLRNRYGTTLRLFDAKAKVWRVTWLNPVSGAHDELVGRRALPSGMEFLAASHHCQNHLHALRARLRLLRGLQPIHDGIDVRPIQRLEE
jgi:hypothetical protein